MQRVQLSIPEDDQILASIQARLPEGLARHILKVTKKGEELVILADAAAWAARLKLALADQPALTGGRVVIVKVAPQGSVGR